MAKGKKNFIQEAIKKPGALTDTVKRRFGKKGFTRDGKIKVSVLRKLAKEKGITGQRARLALTLRDMPKKKKKKKSK